MAIQLMSLLDTRVRRIRLVGVNTPEIGEEGYEEAKEFVNKTCLGEVVKLDVDDKEHMKEKDMLKLCVFPF
ncbi:MAG: hypothetical protein WBB08_06305 [Halobacteriota archaeon]